MLWHQWKVFAIAWRCQEPHHFSMSKQLSAVQQQPLDKQKDKQNSSRLLDSLVLDILDGWCCYNNTTHLRIHSPASSLSAFLSQHHMGFFWSFVSTGMCVNCSHSETRSHLCVLPFLLLASGPSSLTPTWPQLFSSVMIFSARGWSTFLLKAVQQNAWACHME